MKNLKKKAWLFLALFALLTLLPLSAAKVKADEKSPAASGTLGKTKVTYTFDEESGTLTLSGTGYTPTYSGNDTPFYQCTTIKHIVIEEGVTSLRQWLFYELTGVESVSIPSTVTSIDRDAFAGTSVIGDGFTISADNTEFTSVDGSLFNKNKTILYKYTDKDASVYEDYTIPSGVTMIYGNAFCSETTLGTLTLTGEALQLNEYALSEPQIKHLVLGEGVTFLAAKNKLSTATLLDTEITIPASLKKLQNSGSNLFENTKFENIHVADNHPNYYEIDGVVIDRNTNELVFYPRGRKDTSYTTPDKVSSIAKYAIQNDNLKSVTLSYNVEKLNSTAIYGSSIETYTVLNPFMECADTVFGINNKLPSLKEIRTYKNSTLTAYIYLKDINFINKLSYLPDCETHTIDADRHIDPTCTENGKDLCHICGTQIESPALEPLGHDYVTTIVEPTCASKGFTLHSCSRGDSVYADNETEKLSEHVMLDADMADYDSSTNEEIHSCKYRDSVEIPIAQILPESAHPYDNNLDTTYELSYPGAKKIKIKFDDKSILAPYDRIKFYKNSVSSANLLQSIGPGNHYDQEFTFETDHLIINLTSDAKDTNYGFKVISATAITDGCGYIERKKHTAHLETAIDGTPSTCTTKGETKYMCIICAATWTTEDELAPHVPRPSYRVEPTCTKDGYDKCTYCEAIIPNPDLGKLGHDYTDTVAAPTCFSEGYTLHRCKRCHLAYKDNITPKTASHTFGDVYYDTATKEEVRECTAGHASQTFTENLPESVHPFKDTSTEYYEVSCPGATKIEIAFDETTDLKSEISTGAIHVYDTNEDVANYLEFLQNDIPSKTRTYDTDNVLLKVNYSAGCYGLKIKSVTAYYEPCNHTERTPHTEHTEIVKNDTDSTCQTKGKTTYFCTLCNQTTRTVEKELADHSYLGGKCRWCDEEHHVGSFSNINVDEFGILTWDAVDNADFYSVFLRDKEATDKSYQMITSRLAQTRFDLSSFIEDGKTYYIGLWGMSETYDDDVDSIPFEFTYHAHKHDFSGNKQFCTCGAKNPDYVDPSTTPVTPSEPPTPSKPSQGTTGTPAPVTPAPSQTTEGTDTTQTPANSETPQNTVTAPKATSIKSVKGKKKSILIKWKKVKDANGYEIQLAANKKFKKNKKTITIKKQTTRTTAKKLKAKKKYFVRIRTYKIVNGKKTYASWSKVKTVRTK